MKKYLLFLICFLFCVPANADMYSALQQVYQTNPQILSARQKVKSASAGIDLARTGWQPSVGATAGIARAKTKLNNTDFDYTQKQVGITLSENIFHGFSTTAQIDAAKSMAVLEKANLYATEQDVFLQAVNAYINVLNAREVLNLDKNNQKVLEEYFSLCEQKEKVGVLTKTDLAQAKARLELAKYAVIDANAGYENALETFRRIYGSLQENYTDIELNGTRQFFPKSINDAEKTALKSHPAILAAAAGYEAAKSNVTVSRESYMPSIDIKASAVKLKDVPVIDEVSDGRIGIYLTVPLYDKGTAFARTDKAEYEASALKENITQTQRIVLEKLRQAWNIYQAQGAAIETAQMRINANRLALEGVRDAQERGRRTVLDVLNAEQELLDSKVSLTRAKHAQISAYFSVLSGAGLLTADNLGLN